MKITKSAYGVMKIDIDKALDLSAAMSSGFIAQVGILGSKATARTEAGAIKKGGGRTTTKMATEQTNAEIGLKHEKGVFSEQGGYLVKSIPRRSFLEMPITNNARELAGEKNKLKAWVQQMAIGGKSPKECWKLACRDLGILAEQVIQRAFEQHGPGWAPNSPMTKDLKGSDSPLIDTGQMRRSITSRVVVK